MCLRHRGNVGCTCVCGIIVKKTVCVCLRSEVWRSFKGTCSLQEIQGLVSSAVIQFHRHFQQEDLIWLKMWLAWIAPCTSVCTSVIRCHVCEVILQKHSARWRTACDSFQIDGRVDVYLGRSVYEDWGFWMHVIMTNGPAIEIPCFTLSIYWYGGKRFHTNLLTLHLRHILSLDIISTTKEKSERVNEIEREPEAWGAVRFKFVRITSSHLLSVRPWCDGLICLALPVVTVYVRVLRETVQIERQWAVQHFTPQPERGYLIWKQTHTHSPFFWLGPAQHIVSITLLLWPLSRAVSSDCRQIEPLHPLPHWHAHIPLFYPQFLQFPHIFP